MVASISATEELSKSFDGYHDKTPPRTRRTPDLVQTQEDEDAGTSSYIQGRTMLTTRTYDDNFDV